MSQQELRARVEIRGVHLAVNAQRQIILRTHDGHRRVWPIRGEQHVIRFRHLGKRHALRVQRIIEFGAERGERAVVKCAGSDHND